MMILLSFGSADSIKSTVDDALILKIAAGDMDAFHTLYRAAHSGIYGFALSITKNPHDAEDVLQDTFLSVYENALSYRPEGKPMAWIFRIARNFALSKMREKAKEPMSEEFILENTEAVSQLESVEEKETVKALLSFLNDDERQIVMLHAAAGFKNREIAQVLGLKLSTVLSKYRRALKKLELILKEEQK